MVANSRRISARPLDTPVGTTAVELDSRNAAVRTRETAMGALVADAMRWSAQTEVAFTNGGGIRGGKVYPPGATITRRDILAELLSATGSSPSTSPAPRPPAGPH